MNRHELEFEAITVLPTRFETADSNTAAVLVSQGNLGIQIGNVAAQFMGQANLARVDVTQVNF
jgi:hypothetical protein